MRHLALPRENPFTFGQPVVIFLLLSIPAHFYSQENRLMPITITAQWLLPTKHWDRGFAM
jgi:hypothetical protein